MYSDTLSFTDKLENRLDSFEQALAADSFSGNKELWLTGQIDKQARGEFDRRGWKVKGKTNPAVLKK